MEIILGSILCVLGGIGVGTFLLPLKFSKNWRWENSWLVGVFFMYFVFPLISVLLVSENPVAVYQEVGGKAIITLFACGLIQGTGALVFTYGTTVLGLALGYALMIGSISVIGLLVPFLGEHADRVFELDGLTLMAGLVILLVGIFFSGKAGVMRERELASAEGAGRKKVGLILVAAIVLWSGVANSFYYFIHEFGDTMEQIALAQGVHKAFAPQFNNLPFLLGMLVINACITIPKMMKDNNLKNYWSGAGLGREYLLGLLIALPWFIGQGVFFAVGKTQLGPLGVSVGAALFMGTMMVISNVVGVRTGEWKNVSAKTLRLLYLGLLVLVIAMVIIGVGNGLQLQLTAVSPQ